LKRRINSKGNWNLYVYQRHHPKTYQRNKKILLMRLLRINT